MIGIINMPCESPSEYYATPPRSANDAPLFADDRPRQISARQYTPDGKRIGALSQQSQSAESLWAGAIKRSIVYQLGCDELRRKAVSCCNFSQIVDMFDVSPPGKNPTAESNKRKFSVQTQKYSGNNEEMPQRTSLLSPNATLAKAAQELSKSLPR
uniref:Uncharacterized protein n=1 Tax=Parascaris univalens TaxID=6257 RepID=A0A915CIX6_PARUN